MKSSAVDPKAAAKNAVPGGFQEGHDSRGCGKTRKRAHHRGRAALQGRVTGLKSSRALAPVVALPRGMEFFRSLSSPAVCRLTLTRASAPEVSSWHVR